MKPIAAIFVPTMVVLVSSCGPGWQPPVVDLDAASEGTRSRVDEALAAAGESAAAAARLGNLYYALGYAEAAADCYAHAWSQSADEGHLFLASVAARDANRADDARRRLETVLEQAPGHKGARLALAELLLEAGELQRAGDNYRQVIAVHPDDPRALLGLARTSLASGDARQAAEWFEQVLRLRPQADQVRTGLAEAYRQLGRPDIARAQQQRAGPGRVMSDEPELAAVGRLRLELVAETVLELATRDTTSAEEVAGFTVAQLGIVPGAHEGLSARSGDIEAQPAPVRGRFWFAVGALADRQAAVEAAAAAYRKALQALPEHVPTRLRLGRALLKMGDLETAQDLLASADDVDAVRDRALALRRLGRFGEAAAVLEEGARQVDFGTARDQLLLDLAETRSAQGRQEPALEIYETLTESSDAVVAATAWARTGARRQELGDESGAAVSFRRAIETSPDWLTPRYALAATLGRLRRYDEAAAEYRSILDLQPTEEEAWIGAATATVLSGADRQTVQHLLERGLEVLPDSVQLQATLARHLAVSGAPEPAGAAEALQLARSVVSADASPANRETLAMALAASGRFDEAATLQQELLAVAEPADRARLNMNLERYRQGRVCCR